MARGRQERTRARNRRRVARAQRVGERERQAQAQAAVPSSSAPPGPISTPAVAPPATPLNPYLTPDQQAGWNDWYYGEYLPSLGSLDRELADRSADVQRQAGTLVDGRLSDSGTLWIGGRGATQSAQNSFAARGLMQSSIRDTALADIDAEVARRRLEMHSGLATLASNNEERKRELRGLYDRRKTYFDTLSAQNAMGANNGAGTAPVPTAPTPLPQSAPQLQPATTPTVRRPANRPGRAVGTAGKTRAVGPNPRARARVTPVKAGARSMFNGGGSTKAVRRGM